MARVKEASKPEESIKKFLNWQKGIEEQEAEPLKLLSKP